MDVKQYIKENEQGMYDLLKNLCLIPAPSGKEDARAAFCKEWFEKIGATGVYIDDAKNVIFPLNAEDSNALTVYVAHTDTVFPDEEPMPYSDDGEIVRCPGVGDDTASLVVMMYLAKYYVENKITPKNGILFVANSCEEGLGNLKGVRKLFENFAGRVKQFVSFDSKINVLNDRCVGSHRYEVEVTTEGGHSYLAFGKKSAIEVLADLIKAIYTVEPPVCEGSRVTYNVGTIEGGTSVNTIAQSAKMLCEYRSDNAECIDIMQEKFQKIFRDAQSDEAKIHVTMVGDRPCARGVNEEDLQALIATCAGVIEEVDGNAPRFASSSTDCNIPLSLGIPAVCFGVYYGGGMHTREEWIEKKSMVPGLEIAIKVAGKLNENA